MSARRQQVDFDTILEKVGDYGIYQIVLYFFICLPASFPSAWSAFNQVFVGAVPDHWCYVPELKHLSPQTKKEISIPYIDIQRPYEEPTRAYSNCLQYAINYSTVSDWNDSYIPESFHNRPDINVTNCRHGWDFDNSIYEATIATDFELYCERGHLPWLCTTIFYIGSFIGNILFGYIADKWGRRMAFFQLIFIQVVFGTVSAFSPNIYVFTAMRFMVGLTFPALYQIPFIIGMEFMGPPGRMFAGLVVCIFFGIAMCALGFVANWIRQWVTLTIVCNAPFAILVLYWWFLPESPRWLVTQGKSKEATEILLNVGKWNKRHVDPARIEYQCKQVAHSDIHPDEKHGIADLFKTPNLRRKCIILTFVWLVNAVVYNGLTYNVSNLGVNDYFAFAINGAVELPAYVIIWPMFHRFGRRWLLAATMLLGGLACILALFVPPELTWVISGLAFTGKFFNAASFAVLYIFAGELYPTVVRAIGMGFSSMIAGMGLILAPYLVTLASVSRILPLLIMGVLTMIAGCMSMFLPETLGAHLPQNIEDAEAVGRTRFWGCRAETQMRSAPSTENTEAMEQMLEQNHYNK